MQGIGVALFALLRAKYGDSLSREVDHNKSQKYLPGQAGAETQQIISYNSQYRYYNASANLSSRSKLGMPLPTAKPRRPGPKARNRVALKLGVVTITFVVASIIASDPTYTHVSGPMAR